VIKLPGSSPSSAKPSTDSSAVGCSNSEGVNICDTIEVNTSDAETTWTDRDIAVVRARHGQLALIVADPLAPPIRHQRDKTELERLESVLRTHDSAKAGP
jgi:hypothetical protein